MQKDNVAIGNNAVLVVLNIRTWQANVMDRSVSQQVATEHGTDQNLGRFWKTLLPKTKGSPLAEVYATERAARNFHYTNTLEWMHDGPRILTTANYQTYMAKMRDLKQEMEKAVASFLNHYDLAKSEAQAGLKTLFREEDYPDRSTVARKFSLDTRVLPMPTPSSFAGADLSGVEVERAKRELEQDLAFTFQRANEELWTRLYSCVSNVQTRLSGDPKSLRSSMLDNAKELLELLPRLNVTSDANLESMRVKLQEAITGMSSAEALRSDTALRSQASDEVSAIESMMAAYMGGAPASKMELKNAA